MRIVISKTKKECGREAAREGAEGIHRAIAERGEASIILATGASQFDMLAALIQEPELPWQRVTIFHLDEYVGLPITHPASFRLYLWQRFHSRLPLPVRAFHYLDGEGDCAAECDRVGRIIQERPIDVAFIGIGENGHLAFNDPPADFETDVPYLIVNLDEACRRQQLGEGWFPTLEDVPKRAISMSIRQILKSRRIICTVPEERKASAVRAAVEGPVTPRVPASVLQRHAGTTLYLDPGSASQLQNAQGPPRAEGGN